MRIQRMDRPYHRPWP